MIFLLKKFISYYRPHRLLFTADMAASLIYSLIAMLYPIFTRTMLNDLIPNRQFKMVILFGCALLVLYAIRMTLRYFIQYWGHMIGVKMQAEMRKDLFHHLEKLPYTFFDDHETGRIMSRMTNDLMEISELAHHGPENVIISGIMVIASFIYLSSIHFGLTLIIFACVPILCVITAMTRKKMRDAFTESRVSIAAINASLESSISGIRVTKAFTNADKEEEKFDVGNGQFVAARKKAYHAMAEFHAASEFVVDVFNVVVILAGGLFLYAGSITFGDYSTFIVSINLFINPITTLINFMEQYQNGVTGFKRFTEILDQEPEADPDNAVKLKKVRGEIDLKDVSFAYDESKGVLDHISLHIPAGRKLALVGPSGGGKTTICHLLPHFYSVSSGNIYIDGNDINAVTLDSLRRNIGIVQQDVFLFNGTIRENILYGKLNATDEEVYAAARRANIHDYICSLPDGYETQIGERGVRLSGGQKQRLSIARVFLKNPSILILDEATSALDNTTEILIQQALDELCLGRTTLIVAHRLSTIKNADEIAVIADGRVCEQGTHEDLMAQGGIYRDLYNLQFRDTDAE